MIRCKRSRRALPLAVLAATFVAVLTSSQSARAVGVSADPHVPTSAVEHLVVLSRFPHAVVTVWFNNATPGVPWPRVYVLPRPSGVSGSLRFVKIIPLRKLVAVTSPARLLVEPHSPDPSNAPCLDTENILPARIDTAYPGVGALLPHDPTPKRPKTQAELMQEDIGGNCLSAPRRPDPETVLAKECKDDFAEALPYREATGADVARIVRSLGGALPASFAAGPAESFWVIQNPESRPLPGIQFSVNGAFTMPLVAPERGGARETVLVALSDNQLSGATGPFTQKGMPSAFLPKELEGLETGGTYAFPESLPASKTALVAALVAEASFRKGASIVIETSAPAFSSNIAREVCGAIGLRALDAVAPGFVYDPFVVRARVKNTPQLTFENRLPPRLGTTAFLAFETRPEAVTEKSCWRVKEYLFGGTSGFGPTDPLVPIPKISLRSPTVSSPMPTASAGSPGCPCAAGPLASPSSVSPAKSLESARPARVPPSTRGCSTSVRSGDDPHAFWPLLGLLVFLRKARTRVTRRVLR